MSKKYIDWISIQNTYNTGLSWKQVSKKHSLGTTTITNAIKRGQLISRTIVSIDKVEAQKFYDSGMSLRRLAIHYDVPISTIRGLRLSLRTRSEAQKLYNKNNPGRTQSIETRDKISKTMADRMKGRKISSKRFNHNGIILESSWEKKVADTLDLNKVTWTRPEPLVYYLEDGSIHRYFPDFYLPKYNVYLDPKNSYVLQKDQKKLELVQQANDIILLILNENELAWNAIKDRIEDVYRKH